MGNGLGALRRVLPSPVGKLSVIQQMARSEKVYQSFKGILSSRSTMALHETASHPAESRCIKTRQEMYGNGGDQIGTWEVGTVYTLADVDTITPLPYERSFRESEGEIPVVDWAFMSVISEDSLGERSEEVWDDYSILHKTNVGTVSWDELFEGDVLTEDTDGDTVVLSESDGESGNWDEPRKFVQEKKGVNSDKLGHHIDNGGERSKTVNGWARWIWWFG